MATVTNVFNTGHFTADLAAKSFAGMITRLMPNGAAPLFGLTSMMNTETAIAVEHGYFSKAMLFGTFTLGAAVADGVATTFTVVDSSSVIPGAVFKASDTNGEVVIVSSVTDATHIVVTRGIGGGAAAHSNSIAWYQIGSAYEESSIRPNALAATPTRITNYTQIFRNTWAVSGSSAATQVIAGSSPDAENRQDCAAYHARDIESALLFSKLSTATYNNAPRRTMDGLQSTLVKYAPAANITTLGATTTFTQFETAVDPVFALTTDPKGSRERVAFVGGTALKVINSIGRLNGQYQLIDGQTNYGLQFKTITFSRGTLRLIEHPLLNSNTSWSAMMFIVDLPTFNIAYMNGRKTQNKEFNTDGMEANDNGIDAVGGTLTTECTALFKNPAACGMVTNFTAAAVG